MADFISAFNDFVGSVNDFLWAQWVLYLLVLVGVVFTVWTKFGQWRALTHGVSVIRGKYDDKNDPGAINHFQALSTALSATVGLGNISGVALAVNLGGPGAIFWMWVIGLVGMALKMTEVTQAMIFRNTADPDNPHGGAMFVAKYGFARWGFPRLGYAVGVLFVVTLLISAITGGNMFQAWSVAEITENYFPVHGPADHRHDPGPRHGGGHHRRHQVHRPRRRGDRAVHVRRLPRGRPVGAGPPRRRDPVDAGAHHQERFGHRRAGRARAGVPGRHARVRHALGHQARPVQQRGRPGQRAHRPQRPPRPTSPSARASWPAWSRSSTPSSSAR